MILTEKESAVMGAIPRDDFYEDGLNSVMWTDCLIDGIKDHTGIPPTQTRALLITLKTKGILLVGGGREGTVSLTDLGKQWLLENGIVDSDGRRIKK